MKVPPIDLEEVVVGIRSDKVPRVDPKTRRETLETVLPVYGPRGALSLKGTQPPRVPATHLHFRACAKEASARSADTREEDDGAARGGGGSQGAVTAYFNL